MLLWELGRGIVLNWGLRLFLVFRSHDPREPHVTTHLAKKKTAAKLQRLQGPCRVSLRAKLQDLLRGQGLEESHELGTQLAALLVHLQNPKKHEKR